MQIIIETTKNAQCAPVLTICDSEKFTQRRQRLLAADYAEERETRKERKFALLNSAEGTGWPSSVNPGLSAVTVDADDRLRPVEARTFVRNS